MSDRWLKGFDHGWSVAWLASIANKKAPVSQTSVLLGLDAGNTDVIPWVLMALTLAKSRFFHRPRGKTALVLAVGAGALAYFGFHAINGQRGLVAWFQVGQRIEQLDNRWVLNQARIDSLELAVSLLRVESLDPDMLDERARHILGLAHPDEIIILHY